MPYADPQAKREHARIAATKRRAEQRLLRTEDPEIHPLLVIGEQWIQRWVKYGEQLLMNHSDEAIEARRERNRAKVQRHRKKYPERVQVSAKKTRIKHRAKRRLYVQQYHAAHREENNANSRIYHAEHAAEIAARKQVYNRVHAEHRLASHQQWAAAHPEKIVAYSAERRARILNAPVNDLTPAQWREIKAAASGRCAYCGAKPKKLTMDHLTPLSKGGSHTASNVIPACKSCNSKKHAGPVLTPVQPLLFTLEPPRTKKQAREPALLLRRWRVRFGLLHIGIPLRPVKVA